MVEWLPGYEKLFRADYVLALEAIGLFPAAAKQVRGLGGEQRRTNLEQPDQLFRHCACACGAALA